jgi:hypothetical protein
MKIKNLLVPVALLLGVCAGGLATRMLGQPGGTVQAVPIQSGSQVPAPADQKWEYQVVWLANSPQAAGALNGSINQAAAQGFEVQEIVSVPSPSLSQYSPQSSYSPPVIIVLLRRPRK